VTSSRDDLTPRFCERCDVSTDLHPGYTDDDEWECEMAALKADQIDRFFGMVR
jgi:hypothetical protein